MQGELSTPHQRVIIGSLWSTWWLRARCKQLSLQPTLDCLSQQMPFPSPLPAFSAEVPPHSSLQRNREWCYSLSLPAFILSVGWATQACVSSRFRIFVFSQLHKLEKAAQTTHLSGDCTSGNRSSDWVDVLDKKKLTMVLDLFFVCVCIKQHNSCSFKLSNLIQTGCKLTSNSALLKSLVTLGSGTTKWVS